MDLPKEFLLKVEQDYQNQQEKLNDILGGLLDRLNNISVFESLWAAHDDAWKETAEAIAIRIQYKLDEDALLDEIDARKADLAFLDGRLGDVRKGIRACEEEGQ
jgi:hypothetical protein